MSDSIVGHLHKQQRTPLTAKVFWNQFKQIVKSNPDAVLVIDGERLSERSWARTNEAAVELFFVKLLK